MGAGSSFPGVLWGEEDVDSDNLGVRNFATSAYAVGIVLWVVLWQLIVGFKNSWEPSRRIMLFGFAFTVIYLVVNLIMSRKETIGAYGSEKAESHELDRNSFYLVASMFTFSTLVNAHNNEEVRRLLPLLTCALFFCVLMVLAPVWVSTTEPREVIRLKHVKTVFTIWGLGFVVSVVAYLWSVSRAQMFK